MEGDVMIVIEIGPGEKVKVKLRDTDGEFELSYGKTRVTVEADLPDDRGRCGTIYSGRFADFEDEKEAVSPCGKVVRPNPPSEKGISTQCNRTKGHDGDCRDDKGRYRKHGAENSDKCRLRRPFTFPDQKCYCKLPYAHHGNHVDKDGREWK